MAALVAVVVGVVGLRALHQAAGSAQHIYTGSVASIKAVGGLRAPLLQARLDLAGHALAWDAESKAKYEQSFAASLDAFDDALAAYHQTHPVGDPALIADMSSKWGEYRQVTLDKQISANNRGDVTGWLATRDTELNPIITKLGEDITVLLDEETADAARSAADATSAYRSSTPRPCWFLFAGVVTAGVVGLLVARAIVRSLSRVRWVCDGLAEGT